MAVVWVTTLSLTPDTAPAKDHALSPAPTSEPVNVSTTSQSVHTTSTGKAFHLHYGLKSEFDGFIFSHQEMSPDAMADAYRTALEKHAYSPAGEDLAHALFSRYLSYKAALSSIDEPTQRRHIQAVADRLDAREQLRHEHFSQQEYHYLFANDAAYDEAALARLRIANDPDMDKQQKRRLISAQLATLPPAQRQSFQPSLDVNRLAELTQHGRSENAQYQAVAAEFGDDVASRMQSRLSEQKAWKQRVQAYAEWEANVHRDESLSAEDKTALIELHRTENFDDNEARRLQVYLENPALFE